MWKNLVKLWENSGFFRGATLAFCLVGTALMFIVLFSDTSPNTGNNNSSSSTSQSSGTGLGGQNSSTGTSKGTPSAPGRVPFPSPGVWNVVDPQSKSTIMTLTLDADGKSYSDGNDVRNLNKFYEQSGDTISLKGYNTANRTTEEYFVGRYSPSPSSTTVWRLIELKPRKRDLELHFDH